MALNPTKALAPPRRRWVGLNGTLFQVDRESHELDLVIVSYEVVKRNLGLILQERTRKAVNVRRMVEQIDGPMEIVGFGLYTAECEETFLIVPYLQVTLVQNQTQSLERTFKFDITSGQVSLVHRHLSRSFVDIPEPIKRANENCEVIDWCMIDEIRHRFAFISKSKVEDRDVYALEEFQGLSKMTFRILSDVPIGLHVVHTDPELPFLIVETQRQKHSIFTRKNDRFVRCAKLQGGKHLVVDDFLGTGTEHAISIPDELGKDRLQFFDGITIRDVHTPNVHVKVSENISGTKGKLEGMKPKTRKRKDLTPPVRPNDGKKSKDDRAEDQGARKRGVLESIAASLEVRLKEGMGKIDAMRLRLDEKRELLWYLQEASYSYEDPQGRKHVGGRSCTSFRLKKWCESLESMGDSRSTMVFLDRGCECPTRNFQLCAVETCYDKDDQILKIDIRVRNVSPHVLQSVAMVASSQCVALECKSCIAGCLEPGEVGSFAAWCGISLETYHVPCGSKSDTSVLVSLVCLKSSKQPVFENVAVFALVGSTSKHISADIETTCPIVRVLEGVCPVAGKAAWDIELAVKSEESNLDYLIADVKSNSLEPVSVIGNAGFASCGATGFQFRRVPGGVFALLRAPCAMQLSDMLRCVEKYSPDDTFWQSRPIRRGWVELLQEYCNALRAIAKHHCLWPKKSTAEWWHELLALTRRCDAATAKLLHARELFPSSYNS